LSVDLRFSEFKAIETGSGLSSVLLIARQKSRSWVLSTGMIFSLVRVWISVLTCFMMFYGRVLVVLYENLTALCPKVAVGHERAE
jgi:hypothetical protein